MFTLYYTTVMSVTTFALLASVRPFGRLTKKDEVGYFVRLATTTLDERRAAAFPVYTKK